MEGLSEYENVALFSFKKSIKKEFHIHELTSIKTDILDDLGVRNSSVLMANCTVWVEGITDRLYIQKYLDIFIKHKLKEEGNQFEAYREDQHYSFIEYAGGNIPHWSFDEESDNNQINANFISNNILLIADSDYKNNEIPPNKVKRFEELATTLGNHRFIQLEVKEIENLLRDEVILEVVRDYEGNPEITIKDGVTDKSKQNIGEWIESSFNDFKRTYKKGNTLKDSKKSFCIKALKHINSIEDLTEEALSMTEKIYNFIHDRNSDYVNEN